MNESFLLSYMTPGQLIKTQTSFSNRWFVNVVLRTEKGLIVIPSIEEYINSSVLKNDMLKLKFIVSGNEFKLLCIVKDYVFKLPPVLKLKVLKIEAWKDRRESIRYDTCLLCKLSTQNQEGDVAVLTNISIIGAACVCHEQYDKKSTMRISVFIDDKTNLVMFGNIMWIKQTADQKIEYGIKFFNMTEEEKSKIDLITNQLTYHDVLQHSKHCTAYGIKVNS